MPQQVAFLPVFAIASRWPRAVRQGFLHSSGERPVGLFEGRLTPARMTGMKPTDITKEALAAAAGMYFLGTKSDKDIPLKLWINTARLLEASYLRACFDPQAARTSSIIRLAALAVHLGELFECDLVPVYYVGDHEWDEVDAWAAALSLVE